MEIRAGTGGDEAALFAGDLFKMYTKYAEKQHWKTEILDSSNTEIGGFKEITFSVSGDSVYSKLCFESGTHRVQRVPTTETSGRIHTYAWGSAARVTYPTDRTIVTIPVMSRVFRKNNSSNCLFDPHGPTTCMGLGTE